MSKPTAAQIARFRAISTKTKAAANDDAPKTKGTLRAADFVGTIEVVDLKIADDANGKTYMTLPGAIVTTAEGKTLTRTVMAFEAYGLVKQAIENLEDLVVTLRHTGPTLKIVGVTIGGEMLMVTPRAAKAA